MRRGGLGLGEKGPACLQAALVSRELKGPLPRKETCRLFKVLQKWPHFPRRRTSSYGGIPGWEEQGPFLLAASDVQQVLAHALAGRWGGNWPGGGLRAST